MKDLSGKPTDRRARHRYEQRRLFWIVAIFLVVVGGIAIIVIYGLSAGSGNEVAHRPGGPPSLF